MRYSQAVAQLALAMGVDELVVRERLERGRRAFVAVSCSDEAPASWVWVATSDEYAPPIRRMLHVPEGDCYAFGGETLEPHRGRGLITALLEHAGLADGAGGVRTMWDGILDANLASQRASARAGFRPVLRLAAVHEPPPGRLRSWATDYADARLVARARQMLGGRVGGVAGAVGGVRLLASRLLPAPGVTAGSRSSCYRLGPPAVRRAGS